MKLIIHHEYGKKVVKNVDNFTGYDSGILHVETKEGHSNEEFEGVEYLAVGYD